MLRHTRDPFTLPPKPKTGWQLLWWTIFEYPNLVKWSTQLTVKRSAGLYLRGASVSVLLATGLYITTLFFVASQYQLLDNLPQSYELAVDTSLFDSIFGSRLVALAVATSGSFISVLASGVALGLVFGLIGILHVGLLVALVSGFVSGLTLVLSNYPMTGITYSAAFGLVLGLLWGPTPTRIAEHRKDVMNTLGSGLFGGLILGFVVGLLMTIFAQTNRTFHFSIQFFAGWVIGFTRLPLYIAERLIFRKSLDLRHNPYLWDASVRLPIPRASQKLIERAFIEPDVGAAFAGFLEECRPLQEILALKLLLSANAGRWRLRPLELDGLTQPPTSNDPFFSGPTNIWVYRLDELRRDLEAYITQTQVHLKLDSFRHFSDSLRRFRAMNETKTEDWKAYYLRALDTWEAEALKEEKKLEEEADIYEPIATNVYRSGTALKPQLDRSVFFGRDNLRQEFASHIYSTAEMPLFYILGQRRVGKSSVLNFLSELLGSGFVVVIQDLQDDRIDSVTALMGELRRRVASELGHSDTSWNPPSEWLAAWRDLREWLETISTVEKRKLILALDELEELHSHLEQDPQQGSRLLAAIRSFSQHQNRVVFLFVGATDLSELRNPDWNRYFVHAHRFHLDYLPKPDALRLITEPVPLQYPSEVTERLFEITQGHPDLVQRVCQRLVSIANKERRRSMTMADLDMAIKAIMVRDMPPMERFWNEFCVDHACRACVEQLLAGETPADGPGLKRLIERGYVVEQGSQPRLRVPLFEDWLRNYRDVWA